MNKQGKWNDQAMLALSSSVIILSALSFYWALQIAETVSLLELAYGSLKLINNPLQF